MFSPDSSSQGLGIHVEEDKRLPEADVMKDTKEMAPLRLNTTDSYMTASDCSRMNRALQVHSRRGLSAEMGK